jgi:hypothetical protein
MIAFPFEDIHNEPMVVDGRGIILSLYEPVELNTIGDKPQHHCCHHSWLWGSSDKPRDRMSTIRLVVVFPETQRVYKELFTVLSSRPEDLERIKDKVHRIIKKESIDA